MDSEDESLDSTFGQQRAFNLEDPLVDPNVVSYLQDVRTQALTTNAISTRGRSFSPRHSADLYDDEPPSKEIPESLLDINRNFSFWMEWFNSARDIILEEAKTSQEDEEDSLELVLHYLKNYLQDQKNLKGKSVHILNILRSLEPISKDEGYDDELEVDPNWVQSMMTKFEAQKVNNLDDLKKCAKPEDQIPPKGFKEWYRFLQAHEPAHAYFTGKIINSETIWILVQYLSHDWIKDIHKQKKFPRAQRFSAWLLYILFHLPINITAEYVSNLRELGKRCQKLIIADAKIPEAKKHVLVKDCESSEMAELGTPLSPRGLDILRLTLVVIAVVYRQSDLMDWHV